jgi:hypothetical protein
MSNETASAALPAGMSANAFSSLFQAVNGLRNKRALVAMIGCAVVGVLLAGLLVSVGGVFGGLLGSLLCIVAFGTGINAAGTLHMDGARGISPRSTADALVFGLMCIPKLIVLGLALFAVALGIYIVIAILFFICKIPFLGTMLFAVVFPASVVVAGVVTFGLFLCMALSLPAIWQGASITRALAQTLAIARSRLVEAVLLLVFVSFLGFAVSLIVFSVLGFGLMPALALSASIIGGGGSGELSGMGPMGGLMGMAQGGGGHAIAGMIGGFVLWAVALSLVSQVNLLGLCLVYLRVTEGLDLTGTEEALRRSFDEAKRRTAELGEKARSAAQRSSDGGAAAGAGAAAAATSAAVAPFAVDPMAGAGGPTASAVPPAYTPQAFAAPAPPVFTPSSNFAPSPPPAFMAAPSQTPPAFAPTPPMEVSAPFFPPISPLEQTQPPFPAHDHGADIDLSFDDVPAPAHAPAPTAYGVPPAYVPPPVQPAPAPPAAAASTTCPQCLSPVTPDDLFCGVCGYRLK